MTDWKTRFLSDMLNDTYVKFYRPSEHLAIDEGLVLVNRTVTFKKYIPKEQIL
jgi:hypothetical protein